MSRLTAIHRVSTAIVGAQLVVWVATGLSFSWFDFSVVHGDGDRGKPAALRMDTVVLGPHDAVSRAGGAAESVRLSVLGGRAVYEVGAGERTTLVDAATGAVVRVDGELASRIGQSAFARPVSVATVRSRTADGKDAFVVALDDPRRTEVTVDAATGAVTAFENSTFRAFDTLFSLHVLGYLNRRSPANWPVRVASFLGLVAVGSGVLVHLGRASASRLRLTRSERIPDGVS